MDIFADFDRRVAAAIARLGWTAADGSALDLTRVVVEPPRDVRPAPSAAEVALERKVRDVMARASRDLMRIDYRGLSAQGREQYDQAKQFSEDAEQALKDRNFVYALTLADKSATLATQLQGR